MSMIAFSIVFIVIIGLMLIMMSIKHMAAAVGGKGGGNGEKTVDIPKPSAAPAASSVPSAPAKAVAASEDEGELLAVISAAIAAVCGSAARVVAFSPVTRAPVATSWKFASRISNREGFQD